MSKVELTTQEIAILEYVLNDNFKPNSYQKIYLEGIRKKLKQKLDDGDLD